MLSRLRFTHPAQLLCVPALLTLLLSGCGGASSSSPIPLATSSAPAATPTPSDPPQLPFAVAKDDWSTFQHDMQRTGFESDPIGITQSNVSHLTLQWNFQSSASFQASPIVVAGVVYAVDSKGLLTALHASNGSVIWQRQLQIGTGDVEMTPALLDGILFVGARSYTADSSTSSGTRAGPSPLYAVDPTTGTVRWSAQIPGLVHSAPVVLNGTLFVGSSGGDAWVGCTPGGIYTFNAQTGAPGPSWLLVPGATDGGSVWAPISTDGTNLYFGTGNTCISSPNNDSIMSTSTALTQRWVTNTDTDWLDDDDIGGGVMLANGTGYVMSKKGFFYAVNLATGAINWTFATNAPQSLGGFSTPTLTESTIVFGGGYRAEPGSTTFGGWLFGLSLSGAQKWSINTSDVVLSSPASTPDLVFAGLDNTIDALDPQTGNKLWSFTTAADFKASPALGPSGVFVADLSGMLYGFSETTAATASRQRALLPIHITHIKPTIPKMCTVSASALLR